MVELEYDQDENFERGTRLCDNPNCGRIFEQWTVEDDDRSEELRYLLFQVAVCVRLVDHNGTPVPGELNLPGYDFMVITPNLDGGGVGYEMRPGEKPYAADFCTDDCAREFVEGNRQWNLCMRNDGWQLQFVAHEPSFFRTEYLEFPSFRSRSETRQIPESRKQAHLMAGDRSTYRDMYPRVLWLTLDDVEEAIQGNPYDPEFAAYIFGLYKDAELSRARVGVLPWSSGVSFTVARQSTAIICARRFSQAGEFTSYRRDLANNMLQTALDWELELEEFVPPYKATDYSEQAVFTRRLSGVLASGAEDRLRSATLWQGPFDGVDENIAEDPTFPVYEDLLEKTHDHITRGHGWFGVGEWNLACWHYTAALGIALACKNNNAVEMLVRFLADTYVASGDYLSAVMIARDFAESPAIWRARRFGKNWSDIYQAVAFGLAMDGHFDQSEKWVNRIYADTGATAPGNVLFWNVVELILDVQRYRQNHEGMARVTQTAEQLSHHLRLSPLLSASADSSEQSAGKRKWPWQR